MGFLAELLDEGASDDLVPDEQVSGASDGQV